MYLVLIVKLMECKGIKNKLRNCLISDLTRLYCLYAQIVLYISERDLRQNNIFLNIILYGIIPEFFSLQLIFFIKTTNTVDVLNRYYSSKPITFHDNTAFPEITKNTSRNT